MNLPKDAFHQSHFFCGKIKEQQKDWIKNCESLNRNFDVLSLCIHLKLVKTMDVY